MLFVGLAFAGSANIQAKQVSWLAGLKVGLKISSYLKYTLSLPRAFSCFRTMASCKVASRSQ